METLEPSQHCPSHGYHARTSPTCIGMDAWWGVAGVYSEESECKPYLSSGSVPSLLRTASHPPLVTRHRRGPRISSFMWGDTRKSQWGGYRC